MMGKILQHVVVVGRAQPLLAARLKSGALSIVIG